MVGSLKPRLLFVALPLLLVAAWLVWPSAAPASALRGKAVAAAMGCFGCHGPDGVAGIADPTSPGGVIPDWRYDSLRLFVSSTTDVRDWIVRGETAAERQRGDGRHRSSAPMPAYGKHLSDRAVDDLVAYVLAVSGWRPHYSEQEFLGWKIATRLGCFGCHGPSGIGGVPDPGSRSGEVPPLVGVPDHVMRQCILDGGRGGAVRMPAYHDFLSDNELAQLLAYLRSLQQETRESGTENKAKEVIGAASTILCAPLLG